MSLVEWALWGLAGAFVYAAPRLLISLTEAGAAGFYLWRHVAAFIVALAFGPIAGAGIAPFLASEFHRTVIAEHRAIAIVIGMVANPVAPSIVHLVSDGILRQFNAPLRAPRPGKRS